MIGSVGALAGAGILLFLPKLRERMRTVLISYAIGTLLGAVFIGLLPHAIDILAPKVVLLTTLAGIIAFFIVEKILRIPHVHAHTSGHNHVAEKHRDIRPAASLILIGDGLHNFVDGVLITTAFLVSIPLGIITSFAVVAHEVPQELGDFVILLESGMNRMRAYWLNFMSALTTVVGALVTYWFRQTIEAIVPYVLAVSASSFLYIATVDLAPILHHHAGIRADMKQTAGLLTGTATILLLHSVLGA